LKGLNSCCHIKTGCRSQLRTGIPFLSFAKLSCKFRSKHKLASPAAKAAIDARAAAQCARLPRALLHCGCWRRRRIAQRNASVTNLMHGGGRGGTVSARLAAAIL